jgi:carbonic anhydrase/acetyltransferase-like protein (isoleucine patch superfamily)
MRLTVYMPLIGKLEDRQGNPVKTLYGDELAAFQDAILERLPTDPAFTFSQDYQEFINDPKYYENGKVKKMEVRIKNGEDSIYGEMSFISDIALTRGEQEELGRRMDERFLEGWGEQFQEIPIPVEEGILRIQAENPYTSQFLMDVPDYTENVHLKYKITEQQHPKYPKLRQIQALRDIGPNVREGDLGGYVEREWNLDQQGDSWIHPGAVCRERARIQMDAQLLGKSIAEGEAMVSGQAQIYGNCTVQGNAYVSDARIGDDVLVTGDAIVQKAPGGTGLPIICGKSRIQGMVVGKVRLKDEIVAAGESRMCLEEKRADMVRKKREEER